MYLKIYDYDGKKPNLKNKRLIYKIYPKKYKNIIVL